MRIAVVLVAAASLLACEGVAAAAPLGAPSTLRAARPADHAARHTLGEWWTLRLIAPGPRGWIEIRAYRESNLHGVQLVGSDTRGNSVSDAFGTAHLAADTSSLSARGPEGTLAIRRGGRRLVIDGPVVNGALRLRRARRGPAATGWRLGEAVRYPSGRWRPVTLNWSMLVGTAVARGTLGLSGGRRLRLDGWRATYEHGWGNILPGDAAWAFWDEAIVHDRGGRAWIAYGLNRSDTVTGPGARDAQWLGLLARIGARGVRVCRPRVDRSGWLLVYPDFTRWPTRIRARCGGIRLRVRDRSPAVSEFVTHIEVRNRTAAGSRRPGFAIHLSHPGL